MRGHSLLVLAVMLTGCSRFERDWKAALAEPGPATRPGSVEGPWQGRWRSEAGHGGGELRCLLRLREDGRYEARFRATFWGVFKAGYTVELTATPQPIGWRVEGEEDLGWLAGGTYEYEGEITVKQFDCDYRSKHDRGTFKLGRP